MTRSARTTESKNLVPSARPPGSSAPVARARRHVYLSVEERVARGKAARQQAPRQSHRKWEAATNRLDLGRYTPDFVVPWDLMEEAPPAGTRFFFTPLALVRWSVVPPPPPPAGGEATGRDERVAGRIGRMAWHGHRRVQGWKVLRGPWSVEVTLQTHHHHLADAGSQLTAAFQQLADSYEQTFAKVDCS